MGTQTDTHILEYNIVKSYEWNEWELRRKAIKMTNLRTKLTHSFQTDFSNYRRDNVTQTWLPKWVDRHELFILLQFTYLIWSHSLLISLLKNIFLHVYFILFREQTSQTKADNYTNVPQPKVYLAGLRGVPRNKDGSFQSTDMRKIDLTLDVDLK